MKRELLCTTTILASHLPCNKKAEFCQRAVILLNKEGRHLEINHRSPYHQGVGTFSRGRIQFPFFMSGSSAFLFKNNFQTMNLQSNPQIIKIGIACCGIA